MLFLINQIKSFIQSFTSHRNYSDSAKAVHVSIPETKKTEAVVQPVPVEVKKQKFFLPADPVVTSIFGMRTIFGKQGQWHPGIDFSCGGVYGAPIKSPEDGVVILNKKSTDGLTFVAIKGDHSGGYHYLCHVGEVNGQPSSLVTVGQRVKAGQTVGYSNNTGKTTGPHCHHGFYTKNWYCVDVVQAFYKKFAPELVAKLTGYSTKNEIDPSNKSGRPDGGV